MTSKFLKISVLSQLCVLCLAANAASVDKTDVALLNLNQTLSHGTYSTESNDVDAEDAIPVKLHDTKSPSTASSEPSHTRLYTYDENKTGNLLINRKPTGAHLAHVNVTYHSDFKPLTWFVNCYKKKFDNMKVCSMSSKDLWVFLINGKYSVIVGSENYPRSRGGLRIDNGPAIYGYEGELPKPLSVIEKLKKGKVAYTRYQEWPNQYDTDGEVNLKDFNQYFNQMLSEYKKL